MMFRKTPGRSAHLELFIATAQKYLGYSSELLGRNMFGQKVGYDSGPWSGAFVDVVAREAEVRLPSFTYSAAGMAEAIRQGNFSRTPQVGDVAVFNFSSTSGHAASAFSMPHCGIVTDVREFQETGRFITIEGNTTGTGKYQDKDGVHQKIRQLTDVVIFCRPAFKTGKGNLTVGTFNEWLIAKLDRARTKFDRQDLEDLTNAASAPSVIKLNGEIKHGDRNKRVEIIQLALAVVTDLRGCEPGKWDSVTAAACSRFQRNIGRCGPDVTGLPDVNTLRRLAIESGIFKLDE